MCSKWKRKKVVGTVSSICAQRQLELLRSSKRQFYSHCPAVNVMQCWLEKIDCYTDTKEIGNDHWLL